MFRESGGAAYHASAHGGSVRRFKGCMGSFDPTLHVRLMREADLWHKQCYMAGLASADVAGPRGDLFFILDAYRAYFAASSLMGIHRVWLSEPVMQ